VLTRQAKSSFVKNKIPVSPLKLFLMMKRFPFLNFFIVLTFCGFFGASSFAQAGKNKYESPSFKYRNTAQLELMGVGAFYSLNYERNIVNLAHHKTSVQVGGSYFPPSSGVINISILLGISQLISFNQHHIELGAGTMFTFSEEGRERLVDYSYENFLNCKIGYRYQKPQGRMHYTSI
jgi:hypothetical protein